MKQYLKLAVVIACLLAAMSVGFLALAYFYHRSAYFVSAAFALWSVSSLRKDRYDDRTGQLVILGVLFVAVSLVSLVFWGSYGLENRISKAMVFCYAEAGDLDKCLEESDTLIGTSKTYVLNVTDWSAIYPACRRFHGVEACVRSLVSTGVDINGLVSSSDILSICPDPKAATDCLIAKRRDGFPFDQIALREDTENEMTTRPLTDNTPTGATQ